MEWYEDPVYIKMCEKSPEIQARRPIGSPYFPGDWRKPADLHHRELIVPFEQLPKKDWYDDPRYTKPVTYTYDAEVVERESGWDMSYEYPMPNRESSDIWLPTQSQLQKMVKGEGDDTYPINLIGTLIGTMHGNNWWIDGWLPKHYWHTFTSMEQLWFAFVMHENHQKVWNGEDWVKEQ